MCIQMILIEFFMLYLLSLCHIELLKSQEMAWHPTKSRTSGNKVLYNSEKSSSLSKSKNLDPNWSPHIRPYSKWNDGQIMKRLGKPKKSLIYRAKLALPRIISEIEGHKNEHFEPSNIFSTLNPSYVYKIWAMLSNNYYEGQGKTSRQF